MRRTVLTALLLLVATLAPRVSVAQVYYLPTPAPQVTAANAEWQIVGEPVFYAGAFYYPAGPTVFFDGGVMRRTGVYDSVPLYEDATLEPYSIVFVPVGRNLMRPYERRREGSLAATAGSRMPSFPIQRDIELSAAFEAAGRRTPLFAGGEMEMLAGRSRAVDASYEPRCCVTVNPPAQPPGPPATPVAAGPTGVQSIPPPSSTDGVWIVFEDARWYLDGPAVTYEADRFTPIGNYRGFPVYRGIAAGDARIFLTIIPDGPVAPFARR